MKKMFACSTLGLKNERFTAHLQISVEKEHMSIEKRKYKSNTITRIKRRSVENAIRRKKIRRKNNTRRNNITRKKSIRRKHINRTTSFLFSFFHFLMFSLSYSHFRICPFSHFLIFSFSLFYPFLSFFFAFLIFLIFSICSFFYYLIFISQLLGTRAHTQ